MRKSSAGMALVIDDEPAIRRLLAAVLSDYGCAVATGGNAVDLERAVRDFEPDILFLDIGLGYTDALDLLEMLSRLSFTGSVQVVSGRGIEALDRVFQAGGGLGLRMRRPMAKPFRSEEIGRALQEEGLLHAPEMAGAVELGLVSRSWGCASAPTGLIDLAIASATRNGPAERPPTPADQLIWWTTRADRYREPLLDLPAPAAFCIEARVADIPAMMPGLRRTENCASHPAATIVLREEDVFADLATTRDLLCVLRLCGVTIRLTGCGTRFFAIAGHDPLPVDQAVLGNPLSSIDRIVHRLADIAHRAGTLLFADGVGIGADTVSLAMCGLDLWRDDSRTWQVFGVDRSRVAPRLPAQWCGPATWRPVALADALSSRRI